MLAKFVQNGKNKSKRKKGEWVRKEEEGGRKEEGRKEEEKKRQVQEGENVVLKKSIIFNK